MHFGDEAERRRKARIHARHAFEVGRSRRVRKWRWFLFPIVPVLVIGAALIAISQTWPGAPPNQVRSIYFRNCAEAHAAGYYNIPRGSPGYRTMLDADLDGLACEPLRGRR